MQNPPYPSKTRAFTHGIRAALFMIFLLLSHSSWGQEELLAKRYMEDGEYGKALAYFEKLSKKNPHRMDYAEATVKCYQQLERFEEAERFLTQRLNSPTAFPTFYIELGYTYVLWGKPEKAPPMYDKAIAALETNPNLGYSIGYRFQRYALLDEAIRAFSRALELKPELNYGFQLARVHGEKGDIQRMFDAYLDLIETGKTSSSRAMRNIDDFLEDRPEAENNQLFRKSLLIRAQKRPNLIWNELLSGLFIRQKQFKQAFAQERALLKRRQDGQMDRLFSLGELARDEGDLKTARDCFTFISDQSGQPNYQLRSALLLIELDRQEKGSKANKAVEKEYQELLLEHPLRDETLSLYLSYYRFITFELDRAGQSAAELKNSLQTPMGLRSKARLKMLLGDVLVYDQKFNQALVYYSQIQQDLKNDVLAQQARFQVARTSFFKGDFDWALTQLKVLRNSNTQLIANDALQLSLVISDNNWVDSTQIALKKYARADLLAYQKKNGEAIEALQDLLDNHKGSQIEDEALFLQAQLFQSQNKYEEALWNYQKLLEFYPYGIWTDDTLFQRGLLYETKLNRPEKAMQSFETLIYEHQDSYFFPLARKRFRRLRGDQIQ